MTIIEESSPKFTDKNHSELWHSTVHTSYALTECAVEMRNTDFVRKILNGSRKCFVSASGLSPAYPLP